MVRRLAYVLFVSLVLLGLFAARGAILRRQRSATPANPAINRQQPTSQGVAQPPADDNSSRRTELLATASEADPPSPAPAPSDSRWKSYASSEYGFEIKYPADWAFDARYEDNYGKTPSGHGRPAYAGETRTLFDLEMDGPGQTQEGGGDFEDGAIVGAQITGTAGVVENWNITRDRPAQPYLQTSTPADWVKLHTSVFSGDRVESVAIDTNGFKGAIQVACNGTDPCKVFGESGGAYRLLPGGRVLLVSWERAAYSDHGQVSNDFSYQKYFLPLLSSFRLLN
jgi:hypothetical protein